MKIEKRIQELKLTCVELSKPLGAYVPCVKTGNLLYTSGQLPLTEGRLLFPGRVGKEVSIEQAQKSAKTALMNALAAIKYVIRDLDLIQKIVRLNGYVCSAVDFNDQPKVINGASELLIDLFGEAIGSHTRCAVGVLELPLKACVEIDLIVEIKS